jgi:predicted dehydrogenase
MTIRLDRREFLGTASAGAALLATGVWSELPAAQSKSPSEKLNIGFIGTAGQARFSIDNCTRENIAALCDIDDKNLNQAASQFPAAHKYHDFRKLLEAEKTLDALVVATPDHIHAPASVMAMKLGKHVYCEKPLTHSVYEARVCAETAARHKVATQMGTQIHAGENYRRVVEIIQAGAIGKVSEVHVWVGKGWGGGERPKDMPPVPDHLQWDLWLGPAPQRPYHATYLPANWRRWWDFGGGTLGDMACHYMDLPFWALKLRHPKTVFAEGPAVHPETCPLGLKVFYEFPARGEDLPACNLTWYDGNLTPKEVAGHAVPGAGVMFLGEKGHMFADYGGYKLYPEEQFKDFKPPEKTIPRSIGHHAEWIKACKEGTPTTCNFDYSGALTEAVLLGNIAFRAGQKIEWNPAALKCPNCPAADRFLRRAYREGWAL